MGYGGHIIQGHPGLDLVLVVRQLTPFEPGFRAITRLWKTVRPAVVAGDPYFRGDEHAFCEAYERNAYAPFLRAPNVR